MKEETAWLIVCGMCGAWLAVFGVFILLINPVYRRTFTSLQTSREWVCSYFTKEGASDASKLMIHTCNHRLWTSIRPQVKGWALENWARFEQEKPEWFTLGFIAQVADEKIPERALAALKAEGNGERRKSSLSDQLLGDGRKGSAKVAPAEGGGVE